MYDFANNLIKAVAGAIDTVIGFLPDSAMIIDFDTLRLGPIPQEWIQYFNYFFPVQEIVWFMEMILAFLVVYYGRIVILRLLRIVG